MPKIGFLVQLFSFCPIIRLIKASSVFGNNCFVMPAKQRDDIYEASKPGRPQRHDLKCTYHIFQISSYFCLSLLLFCLYSLLHQFCQPLLFFSAFCMLSLFLAYSRRTPGEIPAINRFIFSLLFCF